MIQDYCKGFMMRNKTFETCGRVLRTDGGCDNEGEHATLTLEVTPVRKAKKDESSGSGS